MKLLKRLKAWEQHIDALYEEQGYLRAEDLGINLRLAKLIMWFAWKSNDFLKMSTVVDGTKVVCYHKEATLLGHAHHPNAHVETRYTMNEEFFREKIWKP